MSKVEPPSLDTIHDIGDGVWKATVLKAALELDVFTTIAQGHHRLEEVVATTQCSERGLRILSEYAEEFPHIHCWAAALWSCIRTQGLSGDDRSRDSALVAG